MCETLTCQKPRILFHKIQIRVVTRMNLQTTGQRLFGKLNETNGLAKRISFSHPWGIASDSVTCGDFLTWHTRMVEVGLNFLSGMPDSLPCIKTFKLCLVIIFIFINFIYNSFTLYNYRIYSNKRPSWRPKKLIGAHPLLLPIKLKWALTPTPPTWVNKF